MNTIKKQIMEINRLWNEIDKIYHEMAQSYGISDSVFWILSILYQSETPVSQTELCSSWYYSKQTVNSSVASLVKKGWVILETLPGTRNKKKLILTESGRDFSKKIMGETDEMEERTYSRFTEEERTLFISMFRSVNQYMREEYEKMHHADGCLPKKE